MVSTLVTSLLMCSSVCLRHYKFSCCWRHTLLELAFLSRRVAQPGQLTSLTFLDLDVNSPLDPLRTGLFIISSSQCTMEWLLSHPKDAIAPLRTVVIETASKVVWEDGRQEQGCFVTMGLGTLDKGVWMQTLPGKLEAPRDWWGCFTSQAQEPETWKRND